MCGTKDYGESNIWRLRNHTKCVNSYTMNLMYFSYVFPQFLYGAPLWLFQCFRSVDCYDEPNFGYVGVYKQMNSLYIECSKLILGINVNVSSIALLVRIGWLPLNYVLAVQSLCWLFRIANDERTGIHNLFNWMRSRENDEIWGDSLFFKPAYDMIKRLEYVYYLDKHKEIDFLDSVNVKEFKRLVIESCYIEVNSYWKNVKSGRHTFKLIPEWEKRKILDQALPRKCEIMYYKLSFHQNYLKEFMYYIGKSDNDLCRFCSLEKESLIHVFRDCKKVDNHSLQMECCRNNVEFNLTQILTNENLKFRTGIFLQKYFL